MRKARRCGRSMQDGEIGRRIVGTREAERRPAIGAFRHGPSDSLERSASSPQAWTAAQQRRVPKPSDQGWASDRPDPLGGAIRLPSGRHLVRASVLPSGCARRRSRGGTASCCTCITRRRWTCLIKWPARVTGNGSYSRACLWPMAPGFRSRPSPVRVQQISRSRPRAHAVTWRGAAARPPARPRRPATRSARMPPAGDAGRTRRWWCGPACTCRDRNRQ